MAKITATQLIDGCKKRLGWGYVLGGQGELYSKEMAERFYNEKHEKPKAYYITECAKWFGKRVVDCSGLIIEAFRDILPSYDDQTANGLYSRCSQTGSIGSIPDVPGLCVWKNGHIGIYIGGGEIIESRGKDYGVVKTKVADRNFTNWGKLRDVEYAAPAKAPAKTTVPALTRNLKLTSPKMTGNDVTQAQQRLTKHNAQPGTIDGVFGSKTEAAVKRFQQARVNEGRGDEIGAVDGIIGRKTWATLWE